MWRLIIVVLALTMIGCPQEGQNEGQGEGQGEGQSEGQGDNEGLGDSEGQTEGEGEGEEEGATEGASEGSGEGVGEGASEGSGEGSTEGHGEGSTEGVGEGPGEGSSEGESEGVTEGEGVGEGEGEGEGTGENDLEAIQMMLLDQFDGIDADMDGRLSLVEARDGVTDLSLAEFNSLDEDSDQFLSRVELGGMGASVVGTWNSIFSEVSSDILTFYDLVITGDGSVSLRTQDGLRSLNVPFSMDFQQIDFTVSLFGEVFILVEEIPEPGRVLLIDLGLTNESEIRITGNYDLTLVSDDFMQGAGFSTVRLGDGFPTLNFSFDIEAFRDEGEGEGEREGVGEGEGEGASEGPGEGVGEGASEGSGEGSTEGHGEGSTEGLGEGAGEGQGEGDSEGEGEGEGPAADFSAMPISGFVPLSVEFVDLSISGTSAITSWEWEFGDGGTSTEQNPNYEYLTAGSFSVSLTVTTTHGEDIESKLDYVLAEGVSEGEGEGEELTPLAFFDLFPREGIAPFTVQFTDRSIPGDTDIVQWRWTIGGLEFNERDPVVFVDSPGIFDVELTVIEEDGGEDTFRGVPIISYRQLLGAGQYLGMFVFAQDNDQQYLGQISLNQSGQDSIINDFGTYGNPFSQTSIRNEFGPYGSMFREFSAYNDFSFTPPQIYRWNGTEFVYVADLTTNQVLFPRVDTDELITFLETTNIVNAVSK